MSERPRIMQMIPGPSRMHLLPRRQAPLRRLERAVPAAFLFDQIILDASHTLGGFENLRPRRVAFAEQNPISFSLPRRPVLAVQAVDASRIGSDPGHGV